MGVGVLYESEEEVISGQKIIYYGLLRPINIIKANMLHTESKLYYNSRGNPLHALRANLYPSRPATSPSFPFQHRTPPAPLTLIQPKTFSIIKNTVSLKKRALQLYVHIVYRR